MATSEPPIVVLTTGLKFFWVNVWCKLLIAAIIPELSAPFDILGDTANPSPVFVIAVAPNLSVIVNGPLLDGAIPSSTDCEALRTNATAPAAAANPNNVLNGFAIAHAAAIPICVANS